jgi:hypothetical protein
MVRQFVFASSLVFVPLGVQAQGHGMMAPAFHATSVAPRVAVQVPHAGTAQVMTGTRPVMKGGTVRPKTGIPVVRSTQRPGTTRRRFDDENNGLRQDCNSAPGLGFDAVHQAATCGSSAMGSRRRGSQIPLFFPFFDGGFFLPGTAATVEEGSATETPQPEVIDSEARERGRHYRAAEPTPAPTPPAVETASAAPRENDEFVFVRRDGTVFFAVAYSWEKGTLRYVTNQGLRHTVTQDALDLDATRQFNEQRGLNFRSPA